MTRTEVSILSSTFIGHIVCHASVLIVTGLLVPLKEEFELTKFWVTTIPLLGYILMGVGAVPAGLITDRYGARPVLLVFFIMTGVSSAAAAMAPNVWALVAALTALGATASLYHPTGLAFISHGVEKRGHALGIHGVAGSLGLGGGAIGLWMASMGSWRAAYWLIALVAFASAVAFYVLHADVPPSETAHSKQDRMTPAHRSKIIKIMILLYAATMLSGFNYRSLMTALPTYLTAESSGAYLGAGKAHLVLLVFLIGGIGQYVSGRVADHISPVRLYLALIAISVPLALLLALSAGVGYFGASTAMALALFHFSTQPAENILIAKYSPPRLRSTSYGLKFLVTFGIGALGAPCVGFLWNETGTLAWTFVVFAAVAVIVTAIVLVLARTEAKVAR